MILYGKRIVKLMTADFKEDGYTVCGFLHGGAHWIGLMGEGWITAGERKNMPREVLAKAVEHGGDLPGTGEAWKIRKDESNQLVDWDYTATEIVELMAATADEGLMEPTRLHLRGRRLLQNTATGAVWMMNTLKSTIAATVPENVRPCGLHVRWMGKMSMAAVVREPVLETDRKLIEHLEKFRGL